MFLRDQGAGKRSAHQVDPLVDCVGLETSEDEVAHKLLSPVFHVELRRAGGQRLLFESAEFFSLAHIGGEADDFALIGLLEPPEYHRRIESTRICEHDLAYLF